MTLEYHVKKVRKSWNLSIWGRRMTFGFGANIVTDRVIKNHSTNKKVCKLTRSRQSLTDKLTLIVGQPIP
jgi:hypothetical protein